MRGAAFCLIACALVLFGGGTSITAKPLSDRSTFPYPFNTVNHDSGPAQAVLPVATDRAITGNRQNRDDVPTHQPTFPDNATVQASVGIYATDTQTIRWFVAIAVTTPDTETLPFSPRSPPFAA
ncbi:hypothetical protein SMB34_10925 [Thalassospira permensis NBRC 106175]|uniref:Uncharacterized protein n=2 Tax=Thalassospira permensis TaxID=680197 RepID=A0ABR4TT33_9PROT|nr:hypothetical protein SMB34_10925 [Thalassospira permensis NBRC 106175]